MDGKTIPTVGQLPSGPFPVKSSVGILKPELVCLKDTSIPTFPLLIRFSVRLMRSTASLNAVQKNSRKPTG